MAARGSAPLAPGLRAISSLRRAGRDTWCWFGIYLLAAFLVLEGMIALARHFWPGVRQFALDHVFPEEWHAFMADIVGRLLADQMLAIVASAGMGLGVMVVGMTLFPIKEKLSASFEDDAFPDIEKGEELSLVRQGVEEVKLMAFYGVFQTLSIYLGLQGLPALAVAGTVLSYWYLVVAMALDHAAPIFQRRGVKLHKIGFILFRRAPLSLHLIGAVFILPAILTQLWAGGKLGPELAITLVVGVEVMGMALATLAGCALGAELIGDGALERRQPKWWAFAVTGTTVLVLCWQAVFFSWWGLAIYHKTRLMQCSYEIDWREIRYEAHGKAAPGGDGRIAVVELSAPIEVTNPTGQVVALEGATLEIRDSDSLLGTAVLAPVSAPAGDSTVVEFEITLELPVEALIADLPGLFREKFVVSILVEPPFSRPVRIPVYDGTE